MNKYALIAAGFLASAPLAALSGSNQEVMISLNATQMDSVTAGMISIPGTSTAVTALAEAAGRLPMTSVNTNALVRGYNTPAQFGFARNWIIASGALATATGDGSRSTSYESSEETNGTTILGRTISRTVTVGPTQITGFSSLQPSGLLTYNFLARMGR